MAQKPLMLKDYLELDSCSESFWWTPLHHTRAASIRSLLETELGGGAADEGGWKLVRLKSKSALTRLSTFIKLLQSPLPAAAAGPPRFLPRNFSKKLIRSFRKKTGNDRKDGETVLYPSPVSSSNADVKESLPVSPRTEKGIVVIGGGEKSLRPPAGSREPEESGGKGDMDCPFEEEKEQFSPVSVMDFPYGEEDEDDAVVEQPSLNSSSFDQSVINIERAKNELLQKIRRFESLALDAVDLHYHFASAAPHADTTVRAETDDEEEGHENDDHQRRRRRRHLSASALLRRLTVNDSPPVCNQRLLFDFFVEGLSFAEERVEETNSGCGVGQELLELARGWVSGGEALPEHRGETVVREMERRGGGWKQLEKEKEIMITDMTGSVVTLLMDELVDDLLV